MSDLAAQSCVLLFSENCPCRPVGVLYAPYVAFSGSQGAITSEQNVALLAVFSEAVTGLSASNFKASTYSSFRSLTS